MFNTLLKPPCCNTAAEAKQVVVSNNTVSQQSTATETAKKKVLNKKPSNISFKTVVNRELPANSKLKTKIYSGYIYDENGVKCNITGKSEYKDNFGWDYENNPYINTLSLNISDYEIYISIDRTEYIADMLEDGYTLEQLLTRIKDGRNVHIHSNTEKGQAFIQRINVQGVEDVTSYKVKKEQAEKEQYKNRERSDCAKKIDSCAELFELDADYRYWIHKPSGLPLYNLTYHTGSDKRGINRILTLENWCIQNLEFNKRIGEFYIESEKIILKVNEILGFDVNINTMPTFASLFIDSNTNYTFGIISDFVDHSQTSGIAIPQFECILVLMDKANFAACMPEFNTNYYPIIDSNIVNNVIKLESKKQTLQGYDVHSILNHPLFDDEKRKSGEWAYMINNTVYDANWLFAVVIKNALWNVIDSDSNIEGITRKMVWAVENLGVFNTTYSYNFRGDVLYILPDWSENYRFSISINQTGSAVEADRYSLLYALNEYIERKYKLPNLLSRIAFKPIKKHKTEMELY